jgi:hypothetical protein
LLEGVSVHASWAWGDVREIGGPGQEVLGLCSNIRGPRDLAKWKLSILDWTTASLGSSQPVFSEAEGWTERDKG